jgi:hypothetical protein
MTWLIMLRVRLIQMCLAPNKSETLDHWSQCSELPALENRYSEQIPV